MMKQTGMLWGIIATIILCEGVSSDLFAQTDSTTASSSSTSYTPPSRIFIMPTANPIGGGHAYVADYELFMLYGGVGIGDVVSVTAGTSLLLVAPFSAQIYTAMVKATVASSDQFSFALAGNLLYISTANQYFHLYGVMSYLYDSTWITGGLFYKLSGPDFGLIDAGRLGSIQYIYGGNLGLAVGFDAPLPGFSNARFIGELWDHDAQNPSKTAIMLGVRVHNEGFSCDFGFGFGGGLLVPVTNFVYSW